MDKIWTEMQNPMFWFAAIFVAVVMNVIAAYVKTYLDQRWAQTSEKRKARQTLREQRRQQRIQLMVENLDVMHFAMYREIRLLLLTTLFLLLSVGLLVMLVVTRSEYLPPTDRFTKVLKVLMAGAWGVAVLLSVAGMRDAERRFREILEAYKRRRQLLSSRST